MVCAAVFVSPPHYLSLSLSLSLSRQANPHKYVKCKRICVIDLAGSERAKRTNNSGARLEEASNINLSLMTFKLCIDALRHNQLHPSRPPRPVPYRDSKLTMMFRDYFQVCPRPLSHVKSTLLLQFAVTLLSVFASVCTCSLGSLAAVQEGAGRAAMVVNVNPQVADYDETSRVMKFSAMAQDLKLAVSRIDTGRVPGTKTKSRLHPAEPSVNPEPRTLLSALDAHQPNQGGSAAPAAAVVDAAASARLEAELAAVRSETAQQIEALKVQLVQAKMEAAEARGELVQLEASIREEVASEMAQDIFRNQLECEQRVVEVREALEEKYERKIEILDELNKSTHQRHAAKYQELVNEWNKLADDKDALQKRLESLLAAKESGSDRKYNDVIKQLESQNRALEAEKKRLNERLAEQDAGKQEWKAKVGHIAEGKIAQLEQENAELREELKQLKSGTSIDEPRNNAKRTARGKWGLKKKQRSGDLKEIEEDGSLAADPVEGDDGDWAAVPLEPSSKPGNRNSEKTGNNRNSDSNKNGASNTSAPKGGSWRKRKGQQQMSPAATAAPTEPAVDVLDVLKGRVATPSNGKKHKAKQPSKSAIDLASSKGSPLFADFAAAPSSDMGRQDSNSMMLTQLLGDVGTACVCVCVCVRVVCFFCFALISAPTWSLLGASENHAPRPTSPALHKRSVSHASTAGVPLLGKADTNAQSAQAFVPVLLPAKASNAPTSSNSNNNNRARRGPTKNLF
jgi:hypothetical protein